VHQLTGHLGVKRYFGNGKRCIILM
jgi:hypothetical protein